MNHASIAFHAAMGFSVSEPVTGYNGPGHDLVTFRRQHLSPQPSHARRSAVHRSVDGVAVARWMCGRPVRTTLEA